jgi:hypothetical protein
MTPDTAAYTSPNGRSAFETNVRSRRSQTLSKGWGDRHLLLWMFQHGQQVSEADGLECFHEKACHNRHSYPMLFLLEISHTMEFWNE